MSIPQQTDERLRTWLDSNQLARERLCQAILSLDRRFTQVRPRHPRGGPDGARDLDALYQGGRPAFGAVGFLNSVSDSSSDKTDIRKKFTEDLNSALEADNSLKVFVFFTNVSLTIGEKDHLSKLAREKGIEIVDVVDRERIRIVLDGVDGYAARHQFLEIKMSEAEQTAFFARWGDDVGKLVAKSVGAVEAKLDRIEFLHEVYRPLRNLNCFFKFNRRLTSSEAAKMRVLVEFTFAPIDSTPLGKIHILVCGDHGEWAAQGYTPLPQSTTIVTTIWGATCDFIIKRQLGTLPESIDGVPCGSIDGGFGQPLFGKTLSNFDHAIVKFVANRTVAEAIVEISVWANEYTIWKTRTTPQLEEGTPPSGILPVNFTEEEIREEPWTELKPELTRGWIDFSRFTPRRMFAPEDVTARPPLYHLGI